MTQRHTIAERCNTPTRIDPRLNGWPARRSPRWTMLNDFIDYGQRHLTSSAVRVWLVLFRETKPDGLARITVEQIAARAGICTRSVDRGLDELRGDRFAVCVSRGTRNKGPSVHRLLPISTRHPRRTATRHPRRIPHKGQAHRAPLGASAVLGGEKELAGERLSV